MAMPCDPASLGKTRILLLLAVGHAAAHGSAGTAFFGTFPAMFIVMSGAFGSTCLTGIGANVANILCMAAAHTHELCCSIAQGSAFHVQLYTPGHHFYIFLLGTGRSAMVANCRAGKAGLYAVFVLMISFHNRSFLTEQKSKVKCSFTMDRSSSLTDDLR